MSYKILNGKFVAEKVKNNLGSRISSLISRGITPGLGVILVGDRKDSATYVRMKQRNCEKLGINSYRVDLPECISEEQLMKEVISMNENKNIHGILIQLPLPKHINSNRILDLVDESKDVDGFGVGNVGRLTLNRDRNFVPCTPDGCMRLLDYYEISVRGKVAVILGCSNIVGLPLSLMLLHRRATPIICNSKTPDVKSLVQSADIIFACCGQTQMVKSDWVKEGAIIVDIGINSVEDASRKRGYRLVGDVDFEDVKEKCSWITPVPGGVGPMTIAMLMEHTVEACEKKHSSILVNKIEDVYDL